MSFVYLRNPESGLCLEYSDKVRVQYFTGNDGQLWRFEGTGLGTYFIYNKKSGGVLSTQGTGGEGSPLITVSKNNSDGKQRWYFNSNQTIASDVNTNLVLDIEKESLRPGTPIIAYHYTGKKNQHFIAQQQ